MRFPLWSMAGPVRQATESLANYKCTKIFLKYWTWNWQWTSVCAACNSGKFCCAGKKVELCCAKTIPLKERTEVTPSTKAAYWGQLLANFFRHSITKASSNKSIILISVCPQSLTLTQIILHSTNDENQIFFLTTFLMIVSLLTCIWEASGVHFWREDWLLFKAL